ncbi:MAG: ACT domain-containing protein [Eggerthellaceae bacterium]|jgi:hypothetical protein
MELRRLPYELTVCQVETVSAANLQTDFFFMGKTNDELSLVCPTDDVPESTLAREDGWKAFRAEGVLDFSLVGILAKISGILAENGISIFAVSTFNTDYILVKAAVFDEAMHALQAAGYTVV